MQLKTKKIIARGEKMRKILCMFALSLILAISGCATLNSTYSSPDYGMCPYCRTIYDAQTISLDYQTLQCSYCKKTFERAEGKKLYNIQLAEYNKAVNPSQIIAQEQAIQGTLNRVHDSYQKSADRQQKNMQTFQQNIADWNANWQKNHNR